MKKWIAALVFLFCVIAFAAEDFTVPKTNPTGGMPTMIGGVLFSKATRAVYVSSRVDLNSYKVLGKVQGSVSMWNVLALVNMGDAGWDALKKEVLKKYPEADDVVNFTVDAEYLNVFIIYMRLKVNLTGVAVKNK